jgi:inosine-uridine nucleoside N-ribohydrolase
MRWLLSLFLAAAIANAQRAIPVIIDTDIGDAPDDALALALALRSPELDVRGVTTVIDDVELKTRFAWKQLGIFGRRDIPLAMGAEEPFLDPKNSSRSPQFSVLTSSDNVPDSARRSAVQWIISTLNQSPAKITIIALGPLTNIALVLKTEPRIRSKIERIVIMGGAFQTSRAEYNVKRDRAAAEIVFRSDVPLTVAGLDVTEPCKLRDEDLDKLRTADDPAGRFLLRLVELDRGASAGQNPTLYDPLAVAVAFRPDLIETQTGSIHVPLDGPTADGRTLFTAAKGSTQVGVKVNAKTFLDLFISRVTSPAR